MPITIVSDANQSEKLIANLRNAVGDRSAVLFTDDELAQELFNVFEAFLARLTLDTALTDATSTADPLLTDDELTDSEQRVWSLLAAKEILKERWVEAATNAAIIRSPAGQINTQDIPLRLKEIKETVEAELVELEGSGSGLVFVDLSVMDGVRFTETTA